MKQKKLFAALLCAVSSFVYAAGDSMDEVVVTASRFSEALADKPLNMTVISRQDIRHSSARTLPELLSTVAGISSRDLFGNNAAAATVDMRGFGAAAGQNVLILLDGRPVTDPDLSGVQWSSVALSAVERIEIMRGSGAVLYGAGATGGVINLITSPVAQQGGHGGVDLKAGRYGAREAMVDGSYFSAGTGIDLSASKAQADGYRANNRNEQTNAQGDLRWLNDAGELVLKLGIDRQDLRLPGARTVQPALGIDEVANDPRGTSTPLDYASRDGDRIALEWQREWAGAQINLGAAWRDKKQKSFFNFGGFPNYRESDLRVNSFTPRVRIPYQAGAGSTLVAGVDVYRWDYALDISNSPVNIGRPINRIGMTQHNDGLYLQNTTRLTATTALLAGWRTEHIRMRGGDNFDPAAPGAFFGSAAPAGSFAATKNAYELGLRQQLESGIALNGKFGRSFRFANVDEIYESDPAFTNQFQFLRPQTADGVELGVDQRLPDGNWRVTAFRNRVHNEIHLDAFSSGIGNTNLPPSRRQGVELEGKWQVMPQFGLNATYTYTDARFLSGVLPGSGFTQTNVDIGGKRVPLVSKQKVNLGASWSLSEQTRLNAALNYAGSQFMDNDEANSLGIKIPAYTLADLKMVHQTGGFQLTAAVNNLFDRAYFNYAVSSQFTPGKYNAYPLPGRSFYVGLSYRQ